jgi:hypothetical protein
MTSDKESTLVIAFVVLQDLVLIVVENVCPKLPVLFKLSSAIFPISGK